MKRRFFKMCGLIGLVTGLLAPEVLPAGANSSLTPTSVYTSAPDPIATPLPPTRIPATEALKRGNEALHRHDDTEAIRWYRKAANQNNSDAQFIIGMLYAKGVGVPQNYAEALRWYRKAASQNNSAAQCNIAVLYEMGRGVTQDYAQAMRWYRKAARQNNSSAQFNIGTFYTQGRGVTKDYAQAMRWYRKAASQNNSDAQYNIGVSYAKGLGVPSDTVQARSWMEKAAANGDEDAKAWVAQNGKTDNTPSGNDTCPPELSVCATSIVSNQEGSNPTKSYVMNSNSVSAGPNGEIRSPMEGQMPLNNGLLLTAGRVDEIGSSSIQIAGDTFQIVRLTEVCGVDGKRAKLNSFKIGDKATVTSTLDKKQALTLRNSLPFFAIEDSSKGPQNYRCR